MKQTIIEYVKSIQKNSIIIIQFYNWEWRGFSLEEIRDLENILKNLKLRKRSFLLSGKSTEDIDKKIKEIKSRLENNYLEYPLGME